MAVALTTKAKVKSALGQKVTDGADTLIDDIILQVQAHVEDYCVRPLLYASRTETRDGDDTELLLLKGYPLLTLTSVTIGGVAVDLDDVTVNYDLGVLYRDELWTAGHQNIVVVYTSGFDVNTVGKEPPKDLEGAIIAECVCRYETYATESRVGENLIDLRTRFLSGVAKATFDRWRSWHV